MDESSKGRSFGSIVMLVAIVAAVAVVTTAIQHLAFGDASIAVTGAVTALAAIVAASRLRRRAR